jgi:hypothetical protein
LPRARPTTRRVSNSPASFEQQEALKRQAELSEELKKAEREVGGQITATQTRISDIRNEPPSPDNRSFKASELLHTAKPLSPPMIDYCTIYEELHRQIVVFETEHKTFIQNSESEYSRIMERLRRAVAHRVSGVEVI